MSACAKSPTHWRLSQSACAKSPPAATRTGGLIKDADPGDVVQREGLETTGIHVMPA